MAKPAPAPALEPDTRRRAERRLFLAAAVLLPLVVVVGFARTYYFKTLFDTAPLTLDLHIHGLVMTAWVLVFAAQVALVNGRRVALHQRLGYASLALAALVVLMGLRVALRAAKYGPAAPVVPGTLDAPMTPMEFLIVSFGDLVVFTTLFTAAIVLRRRPTAHKGLMLLAAIGLLPPALGRIPSATLQAAGPLFALGVPAVLATAYVVGQRRRTPVPPVVMAGAALLVASYPLRLALAPTAAWLRLAAWLTRFV